MSLSKLRELWQPKKCLRRVHVSEDVGLLRVLGHVQMAALLNHELPFTKLPGL